MRVKGINRIAIGVEDLQQGIEHYSKLLNTTFEVVPAAYTQPMGSDVAISWEAGIELVAQLPGEAGKAIGLLPKKLGLMGVIFNVEDIDAAAEHAKSLGVDVAREIRLNADQMNAVFGGKIVRFDEVSFEVEKSGIPMVLGDIAMADER